MNYRVILQTLGRVVALEGVLMLLPLITSLCYGEWNIALVFLAVIVASVVVGVAVSVIFKPKDGTIFSREGLVIVALAWIVMSAVGALPFVISGEIPSYVDAFFETVSGFTTTGATIIEGGKIEELSRGILMWRSFTHWIGGMGVLVFVIAVTKASSDRNIHIMRAEMPGPIVDKLTPRSKDTAKVLYYIYIGMTVILFVTLLFGGMDVFDSLIHTFGTAGTGGFSSNSASIANYNAFIQWVIAIFMLLFGINFNLYYLILIGKFTTAIKSRELWVFVGVIITATIIVVLNTFSTFTALPETIRGAFFQVTSIISTTGFTTVNFDAWNQTAKTVLLALMFIGGCAGSTAGGLKVSRIILLFKSSSHELQRVLHPRTVKKITFDGKAVDEQTVKGVGVYLALYIIIFASALFMVSFDGFAFDSNFSAVAACFNNVGPGFNDVFTTYAGYSSVSKIVLSSAMLFGRLEIYPLLLLFSPTTWKK